MTAPSRITLFGQEYHSLLELALAAPADSPTRVQCESQKAAQSLRRKLYEFFDALRKSPAHAQQAADADKLMLQIDACAVVLSKRVTSAESLAILAALGNVPAAPVAPVGPAPQYLERLAQVREARGKKPTE